MASEQEALLALSPYPPNSYSDVDLNRLTVVGIDMVQELALRTTLENITVALFRLFPCKFSLSGFPFPDSNKVNRALLQLRPKYRNWAAGDIHTGFALTATGQEVLEQTRQLLGRKLDTTFKPSTQGRRIEPRPWEVDPQAELEYVRSTELFAQYQKGSRSSADLRLVYDVLRVFPYTPKGIAARRRRTLLNMARETEDKEMTDFLEWLGQCHPRAFAEPQERRS